MPGPAHGCAPLPPASAVSLVNGQPLELFLVVPAEVLATRRGCQWLPEWVRTHGSSHGSGPSSDGDSCDDNSLGHSHLLLQGSCGPIPAAQRLDCEIRLLAEPPGGPGGGAVSGVNAAEPVLAQAAALCEAWVRARVFAYSFS